MARLDVNKDGYVSREDFELMAKRVADLLGLSEKQAGSTSREFAKLADALHLEPGLRFPIEEGAQHISKAYLCKSLKERKAIVHSIHKMLFDILDANDDGHITLEEFKIYYRVLAPATSEADIVHCFNTIDTNKNGVLSREEFMAAAEDFLIGVEETELSKVFFGPLMD